MKTKRIYSIFMLLIAMICALSFTACNGDSDTDTSADALTYEAPVKEVVDLLNNKSTDIKSYITALTPKFINKHYDTIMDAAKTASESQGIDFDAQLEARENQLKTLFDSGDFAISYSIKSNTKMSDEDIDTLKQSYQGYAAFLDPAQIEALMGAASSEDPIVEQITSIVSELKTDLENINIEEGYDITVEISATLDGESDTQEIDLSVIKIDGEWKIDLVGLYQQYSSALAGLIG